MDRIGLLQLYMDELLLQIKDVDQRREAYVHLYGVAQTGALIAMRRGENAELATMAGMLHDIYAYLKMNKTDHEQKGAVLAREILQSLRVTDEAETELICQAIETHGEKELTHGAFAEVLIDADVMQHCLYNPAVEVRPREKDRFARIKAELGMG